MPVGARIATAAPPYVDCIQWTPRRFAGGVSPVTVADLVFAQAAIAEIHARLEAAQGAPVFGAIAGTVFEDPTCARRWACAEAVVPSRTPVAEDAGAERLGEVVESLRTAAGDRPIIGWYRSHHRAGLYLSPDEAEFHDAHFSKGWEFALILAGSGERLAGGVFQRTRPEGLSRSVYTPFYELSPNEPGRGVPGRPTVVAWANYQTESKVVRPDEGETPVTVATIRDLATPTAPEAIVDEVEALPSPPRSHGPAVDGLPLLDAGEPDAAPPSAAPTSPVDRGPEGSPGEQEDPDAEWEKIQIQRSLMAVGRSLGPSTIGELGAPASDSVMSDNEPRDEETARTTGATGPEADETADTGPATERAPLTILPPESGDAPGGADRSVIPITGVGSSVDGGLVGRSRRRQKIPVKKIAVAAAGVVLMVAAGWVGTMTIGANGRGSDGAGSRVAGLTIAPDDLFGRDEEPSSPSSTSPAQAAAVADSAAAEVEDGDVRMPEAGDGEAADDATDAGTSAPAGLLAGSEQAPDAGPAVGDTTPIPSPRPPEVVDAPQLDDLVLEDPAVSAYENALQIFRSEIARYDTVRTEFDQGLSTCNPLNLAYRGVRDSHRRLERRYADVQAGLAPEDERVYRGGQRQYTVAKTHFELTDCPMPVGG